MRRSIAAALLLSFGTARAATAEHLVPATGAHERLAEAASQRVQKIAVVESLLDTPEAARASATLGVDMGRARSQVALLSDDDLRDLSLRAQALGSDPVAGSGAEALEALGLVLVAFLVLGYLAAYANRD